MRKLLAMLSVLGLSVLLGPATAWADLTDTFLDTNEGQLQIQIDNGAPSTCGFGVLPETCGFTILFSDGEIIFPPTNLSFNIYNQAGVLSDTLVITSTVASSLTAQFVSDTEGVPLIPLVGGTTIIETGGIQTAATIPLTGSQAGTNFVLKFQSDADVVPEPSSLLLFGSGLLGLTQMIWRRKRLS